MNNKDIVVIESLEKEQIMLAIESENLNALSRLEIFDTIDSTNTYLLQQAKQSAESGWVCFAEEQTQGRGRRGRDWFSPRGRNIYCSMLWRFNKTDVSSLSIAVGVMLVNVLKKYGIQHGLALKWPNDILFAEKKLAGILLERLGEFVVIGIGLNLDLPANIDVPNAVALAEITGNKIQRNYLAGLLVNELLKELPIFAARGLTAFVDEWHEYDALINQKITVHTAEKIFQGEMRGINRDGELLLLSEDNQLMTFCYGEVSVRKSLSSFSVKSTLQDDS